MQQTGLTRARSQVSASFYTDQGYQILNPSIIWNLLGQWRGKSFPSLGAENGFVHISQVCERERRNKLALAWDSPRLENSGKTCKFLVLEWDKQEDHRNGGRGKERVGEKERERKREVPPKQGRAPAWRKHHPVLAF